MSTLILSIFVSSITIFTAIVFDQFEKEDSETRIQVIKEIALKNKNKCPYCGAEFESNPLYCYKCSKKLTE